MRRLQVDDLVYQVATLVLSFLIVHVPYTLVVRPNARAVLEEQARQMAQNPEYVQERSWWVVMKDYEQEAEFVLCLWALFIMGAKWRSSDDARAEEVRDGPAIHRSLPGARPVHCAGAERRPARLGTRPRPVTVDGRHWAESKFGTTSPATALSDLK